MAKKIILIIFILFFVSFLVWLFIVSTKSMPGESLLQSGSDHKPEDTKLNFQFNPPTSGDHFEPWVTKGFYDEPRADGYLVHSLEHGYVIIWYDCDQKIISFVQTAYAHEEEATTSASTGSAELPSAHFNDMPKSFSDGSCDILKNQIKEVMGKSNPHKLIGIPRVGMDNPVILTAWGRMEKLNSVDKNKIKEFIDAFRDKGPEKTNEP